MSIRANFELILHIQSLTNIQIPHQGLFAIEAEIYSMKKNKKNYAIPYKIIDNVYKTSKRVKGKADINDVTFRTKIGFVRYSDQTVELNDMVQFKLQIPSFPSLNQTQIYIDFHLLFSGRYYADEADFQQFSPAQTEICTLKLENIQKGIFHFCQGQFTQSYLSLFSFTLFAMLTDYKFIPFKINKEQPIQRDIQREKLQDINSFATWLQKYYENCKDPVKYLYQLLIKPLSSRSYQFKFITVNEALKTKKQIRIKLPKHFTEQKQIAEKQYYEYLSKYLPQFLPIEQLTKQLSQLHMDNFFYIQQIAQDFAKDNILKNKLKEDYDNYMKQMFGEKVFKSISYGSPKTTLKENQKIVKAIRNKNFRLTEYPILDLNLFLKKQQELLGFYEITYPEQYKQILSQKTEASLIQQLKPISKLQKPYDQSNMLIVFCHGFQGSSYDMMMIHRGMKKFLPNANFLLSLTNELDTERNIQEMGQKLSLEVLSYIHKNMEEQQVVLNFIGHSMGGIIARSSLKHLSKFHKQLGFFCTLGSPHLGYLNGVDGMIKTGLWFLNKWKKIISLEQLSMDDTSKPKDSYMYKLSKQGTLKDFKKIILISSMEDSFVPWHSARICPHKSENSSTKIQRQMADNILGQQPIHRLDINFNVKKNDLDGFIGRTAHINLIIQDNLFKLINWTMPTLFDLNKP